MQNFFSIIKYYIHTCMYHLFAWLQNLVSTTMIVSCMITNILSTNEINGIIKLDLAFYKYEDFIAKHFRSKFKFAMRGYFRASLTLIVVLNLSGSIIHLINVVEAQFQSATDNRMMDFSIRIKSIKCIVNASKVKLNFCYVKAQSRTLTSVNVGAELLDDFVAPSKVRYELAEFNQNHDFSCLFTDFCFIPLSIWLDLQRSASRNFWLLWKIQKWTIYKQQSTWSSSLQWSEELYTGSIQTRMSNS